ncbi:YgfZ/GcvT domain-containing protein [Rhodoferax mekongensis]|uniref:Folate-binding protein n=1 Tax=Rhodoferax mekongensis TaxID=3068341 RepID=A0ABZ0AWX0_9BURK|nr:folate-binding protein [Rhodoferax sp. TBRC 17307]WNO03648.1 folate-binding protein [Rhodoferax sp. TBRC 17307]
MTSQNLLPSTSLPDGIARLNHLGVILIHGEDAAKFIHGQLTQDFALLGPDQARLAAFCSAKGRMQASFVGIKAPDGDILLVCSRDLLPTTLKRLSMFVMRAKAKLTDASEDFALWGLAGNATKNIAAGAYPAWAKWDIDHDSIINLYPAAGVPRQLLIRPANLGAPEGPEMGLPVWQWGEVMSGVATLTAPVVEAFVPQMLNYESVGGVSFKKGCYPGQEVVARSQFRGTLKRRAFVGQSASLLSAGQEVFANGDAEQPVGLVVQAAHDPQGGSVVIVSLQLAATDGLLRVGDAEIQLLPLPYPLLEDI